MKKSWKSLTAVLLCGLLLIGGVMLMMDAQVSVADKKKPDSLTPSSPAAVATGNAGMVVTAHPLASKVGAEVLKDGGNAVDAAVAIQFALNVTEPMMSGIGGGGFMMVYEGKSKKVTIINSRERAPKSAHPRMFLDANGKEIPFPVRSTQGYAVGVPGTVKGLYTALEKWGTRPMSKLIQPAIELAEKGVPVNRVLAKSIADNQEALSRSAAKDVFLPGGKPLKEGDRLVQKDLAKTFRLIQSQGWKAFYEGPIAKALVQVVNEKGGKMDLNDLKRYQVTIDQPLWSDYKGYRIATMPPPSSGVTMLQILKLLDEVKAQEKAPRSADKYHLFAEVSHLAYSDRGAYIGDPAFVDVPLKGLLDPQYVRERAKLVNPTYANASVQPGDPWKYEGRQPQKKGTQQEHPPGQTTHFTVADRWGNIVSFTTTIEQEFGTGIMVPGYGFLLNNELTDFDVYPGGPNEVQPDKRPRSSMMPTIIFKDEKPIMTVGSPGGSTIISSVYQVIFNRLSYGMDLKAAVEEPRIFSDKYPMIRWEKGVPDEVRKELIKRGHQWEQNPKEIGNANAMWIDHKTGVYTGVGDSSRESTAIGLWKKK
ncbi:gamma-glutamyltransferase [Thermoflavimicrobium dichotomicum]|uniref:Glutathione hydrolase proenzyme n=1 Tax=Thermoflavimicrobium dichotomicum TaxID=46223 RepID=A0A1I3RJA4_9BACL|nr:gamma-glutamyltransferase [Thermoflavimicrobium dichotomicum]SFJ46348.1 gamma-glutamyltranspeptidase / glutathione hydrolase [Thermoflavimicrobium dichotomicum]